MTSTVFPLAPYSVSMFLVIAIVAGVLLAGLTALFLWLGIGLSRVTLAVNPDSLEVKGIMYGRTIPKSNLKIDQAKVVNIDQSPDLQAVRRTSGVGLSKFKYGWFKLKNGEKALMVVSDRKHAIQIPTTEGYMLLVSPQDPEAFLSALRT